jgi:hypothetical protein
MPRCRVLARRRLKTSRSLIAATCCSNNQGERAASLPGRIAVQSLFSCVHDCLVRTIGCRLHTRRSLSLRA